MCIETTAYLGIGRYFTRMHTVIVPNTCIDLPIIQQQLMHAFEVSQICTALVQRVVPYDRYVVLTPIAVFVLNTRQLLYTRHRFCNRSTFRLGEGIIKLIRNDAVRPWLSLGGGGPVRDGEVLGLETVNWGVSTGLPMTTS